ncbi:hypothetical protein ACWKT5_30470 [Streptomyces avermitilis]
MSDVSSHEDQDCQLALLCQQLARLRRMHRGPVGASGRLVIDRAVRAAREGGPIGEHLEALGLLPGRTADEADEGAARGTTLPPRVADGAPHALLGQHVCPRGVCTRREQRAVGEERPVCEIFDLALRFDPER